MIVKFIKLIRVMKDDEDEIVKFHANFADSEVKSFLGSSLPPENSLEHSLKFLKF